MPDRVLDASSAYGILAFGVLPPTDSRLARAFEAMERELIFHAGIGGVARYQGDQYYRVGADTPGNPWIVTTLWLAEYFISRAQNEQDFVRVKEIFEWVVARANISGALPEQIHPYSGVGLSTAPLVWSHAAYVNAVISYLDKLEELGLCKACDPVGVRSGVRTLIT